ncbi:MAG: hypothetical protein U1D99_09790, partial [Candidatus Omnitrophota bacterium]|nr:hypothetical protein [Candidatus Omnitrophota bacterium]
MKLRLRLKLVIPSLITFVIGFIGSPLFTNWYFRPVIVVDIKEFDLPKEYFEIVGREELSGIPRISLIEITNIGKSKGDNLTLEFKANNNASISGASVESRSDAISHKIEKLKDGSALLKLDAYH